MNTEFDELKETITALSKWLDSIPPYEYSLYATIIAYIISSFLTTTNEERGALNALGNWFEQLGQIMLTIAAQQSASPTQEEYEALKNEVRKLRREVNELKNND